MLSADALKLTRGQHTWEHSFQVSPGASLAIAGPSGQGKSTLLEAIAGFVKTHSGQLLWHQESLLALPPERRPVTTLFQDNNLFEHLSVQANLALGFRQGRPTARQWQGVQAAGKRLGVDGLFSKKPGALSGGQRQRIALIRAVLRPQPIVLLDEPFSALDDDNRERAGNWMRRTTQDANQVLLFVSHNREDAERWADDILRV